MSFDYFQEELERSSGMKLKLRINDNRSTMLSVKWEPDKSAKISLHRFFLDAPRNVMDELACYIRGDERMLPPAIKSFIDLNLKKLDYSHELNKARLAEQGNVYNLKKIFDKINSEYFDEKVDLNITWFSTKRSKNKVTFGLYHHPLKLIKINRLLDSPSFPEYFVSFVIYHEMLHHVCPSYVDENGVRRVHNKEFKEREAKFRHFQLAKKWVKDNHESLFSAA